jgi:hypothetical protein
MRALLCAAVLVLAGCASRQSVTSDLRDTAPPGVRLEVVARTRTHRGVEANVRLVNGTHLPLEFTGYSPEHPFVTVRHRGLLGWSDPVVCMNETWPQSLGPHTSVEFQVLVRPTLGARVSRIVMFGRLGELQPFRIVSPPFRW